MISADTSAEPRFQISDALSTQLVFGIDVDGWRPGEERVIDARAFGYPLRSLAESSVVHDVFAPGPSGRVPPGEAHHARAVQGAAHRIAEAVGYPDRDAISPLEQLRQLAPRRAKITYLPFMPGTAPTPGDGTVVPRSALSTDGSRAGTGCRATTCRRSR